MTDTTISMTADDLNADALTVDNTDLDRADRAAVLAISEAVNTAEARVPGTQRDLMRQLRSNINDALSAAETASALAATYRTNLDMYPAGREQHANEAIEDGDSIIRDSIQKATAQATVLEAGLLTDAFPEPRGSRATTVRQDVLMVLDRADNAAAAMEALAADHDPDVRALVAGTWGRRYATAKGLTQDTLDGIRHTAITTEASTGNGDRAKAAQTLLALDQLVGAIHGTAAIARNRLHRKG